mgnify:CR=1 FL=1
MRSELNMTDPGESEKRKHTVATHQAEIFVGRDEEPILEFIDISNSGSETGSPGKGKNDELSMKGFYYAKRSNFTQDRLRKHI